MHPDDVRCIKVEGHVCLAVMDMWEPVTIQGSERFTSKSKRTRGTHDACESCPIQLACLTVPFISVEYISDE
jgi:hypothetical protein